MVVVQVAWPALTACAPQPEMPVPFAENATVPELTVLLDVTVAVKLTELLGLLVKDGFRLEETVVVVPTEELYINVSDHPVIEIGPPSASTMYKVQVPSAFPPPNLPFSVALPSVCGQLAAANTGDWCPKMGSSRSWA